MLNTTTASTSTSKETPALPTGDGHYLEPKTFRKLVMLKESLKARSRDPRAKLKEVAAEVDRILRDSHPCRVTVHKKGEWTRRGRLIRPR